MLRNISRKHATTAAVSSSAATILRSYNTDSGIGSQGVRGRNKDEIHRRLQQTATSCVTPPPFINAADNSVCPAVYEALRQKGTPQETLEQMKKEVDAKILDSSAKQARCAALANGTNAALEEAGCGPISGRKKLRKKHKATEPLPHFDVCVIGGGPAGVASALRAVDYNKKVCLIEKGRIGGADLWNGALQSKTMWEMSKFINRVKGETMGRIYDVEKLREQINFNESKMRASLIATAEFREAQVLQALNAANVRLLEGSAMFASPTEVNVHNDETGEYNTVTADYFVIATGSSPRSHPHFPNDGENIITSDEIMMQTLPKSVVIVGAGVIGCEFASIFANFGKTKVHIIDKAPRILPMEDEDIALYVQSMLEKKGVVVHHEASLFDLQAFENDDGSSGVQYMIMNNKTKEVETHEVERALISIGRVPNYKGLGLENTKCKVTDGRMKVDGFQRCAPHTHIYAVGDATVDIALVNMAETEGKLAIDHMYSARQEHAPVIDNLSTIMFLDEEVAAVGLNEQQCRQQQVSYMMARYGYEFVGRAVAMGETQGFIKIIVTNDREKRVLGVRAVGPHASSVVELASLAIHNKASAYELAELMTAYPAVTQGFQECLRMLLGRSILKPNVFPQLILKTWEPSDFERGRSYRKSAGDVKKTCAPPPDL